MVGKCRRDAAAVKVQALTRGKLARNRTKGTRGGAGKPISARDNKLGRGKHVARADSALAKCGQPAQQDDEALTEAEVEIFRTDFQEFDVNGSGFIELGEISKLLLRQLDRKPTSLELDATLAMFDTNEDGRVSFHEYMQHIVGGAWLDCADIMMHRAVRGQSGQLEILRGGLGSTSLPR
eukprot:TRINITY_DN10336_c0_g1_i2.p1 TRINITY_DN10336_c0_g1~~TRINITY_DN10336_c0_g1_i2.p1  ORF type:complete len:180 (-),score=32.76 TRINITY_DN10336_c0_g1_i2:317-856(-)